MQAGHGSVTSDVGVEWLGRKGSWTFYITLLLVGRVLMSMFGAEPYAAWTLVNTIHCVITFFTFHWVKGNPYPTYWLFVPENEDRYTWWEQIDHGWQFTPSRKFCILLVVVLYLMALGATPWTHVWVHTLNFAAFVIAFTPKMPCMDKVRLFGINK
eukprot:Plantae.Rhodophyta-Purpureofilum_apyrenoidigerum.ctg4834.p1 GENE.Plantae.Rhodophyta-Purpureofilum_apyrenoidigerum.ctg4834~~Plantae.Rhodophyta-Purpureofilum_apyrenoidigerum.ctg4834.p1  ORF type:complete len:156 (-),score=7.42 Plantae.Rhodophyta-Purpureofilum_apyrenoidigerum.ctg4834:651-1118(-)